jgi:predicted CXXCH cytochrome family protein
MRKVWMKKHGISIGLILALGLALFFARADHAGAMATHGDPKKNPRGCAGCHSGRGVSGTPLLRSGFEGLCFTCHGSRGEGGSVLNIESLLEKESVHPVKGTARFHRHTERLPEVDPNAPRHVSCYDCHRVHLSETFEPTKGARGYAPGLIRNLGRGTRPQGRGLARAEREYEVCYLCHADSANLPEDSRNVAAEFDPSNASFHPVERPGRGVLVPSLIRQFSTRSTLSCGDCHGNDDIYAPRGPHGSDYEPLLIGKYVTEDGPEDTSFYELCYLCHERQSILGDQSFKTHNLHVAIQSTSCFTCHASHGSRDNEHLIQFNPSVVVNSGSSGGPVYIPGKPGEPMCYLSCHGADHNITGVGDKAWQP